MDSQPDILLCPFCGGKAILDQRRRFRDGPDDVAYFYLCRSCACEGPWAKTEGNAKRQWNMRAGSTGASPDIVTAAKELLNWVPTCSKGSEGYRLIEQLKAAIANFGKGGSLNQAVGVEADLKHPANSDTGGEIAESKLGSWMERAAEEIARQHVVDIFVHVRKDNMSDVSQADEQKAISALSVTVLAILKKHAEPV